MVAELVETTRLWGHTAARIDPAWIEPIAPAHLLRHSYGEPRWDERRGAAVVDERVSSTGCRSCRRARSRTRAWKPDGARELFLRRALVAGEWEARHDFLAENARRIAEVEALEDRARRRDLLADEETRFRFFDNRVPADVVSGVEFERWWKDARRRDPELLTLPRELLRAADAEVEDSPTEWRDGELSLPLSYRFEPGATDDGVTVHVPLERVGELRADEFSWLVPGAAAGARDGADPLAAEGAAASRSCRSQRSRPQTLARLTRTHPPREPLLDALARELERRGVRIPREAWAARQAAAAPADALPRRGRGRRGRRRGRGPRRAARGGQAAAARAARGGDAVDRAQRARAGGSSARCRASWRRRAGGGLRAFPALVDEGETVGVRLFETPGEQASAMHAGTRRLLRLTRPLADPVGRRPARHAGEARADDGAARQRRRGARRRAAGDARRAGRGRPAVRRGTRPASSGCANTSPASSPTRRSRRRARWSRVLEARREVERRLDALPTAAPLQEIRLDVARQLGRLVHPGCAVAAGAARLPDVERYLRAAAARLDRLPDAAGSDRDRMRTIHELEAAYEGRLADWPRGHAEAAAAVRGALDAGGAARRAVRAGARRARRPTGLRQAHPQSHRPAPRLS